MIDPGVVSALSSQWNYLHIHDEGLAYIRERGVTDEDIETMLVEVPRRYFEHTSAY
jgi:phosphotriesterase-related protein